MKQDLQGMIVDGTNLTKITKEFKLSLGKYVESNKKLGVESLNILDITREKNMELLNHFTELCNATQVWYELQFYQPQEVIPELIYEFEMQYETYLGMKELLLRHDALWVKDIERNRVITVEAGSSRIRNNLKWQ